MPDVTATLRIVAKEEVSAQMQKARKEMEDFQKRTESTKGSVRDFFKELAGPAAAFGSAAGLALIAKGAVEAASRLEALQSRAQAIYGDSFPQMSGQAEALGQKLNRSASDMLEFETSMAGILQGGGVASSAMMEMSGSLAELTVKFGSFFHIADDEAFRLLQSGILGSGRALQRYGVIVNDATVSEYAHQLGIKTKTADMSEAQLMTLRYGLIMQETNKIQSASIRQGETLDNQLKHLKGAWTDFLEVLGSPALTVLAAQLGDVADVINKSVIPSMLKMGSILGGILSKSPSDNPFSPFKNAGGGFLDVGKGVDLTDKALKGLSFTVKGSSSDIKELYKQAAGGSGGAEKAAEALNKIKDSMEGLGHDYDDATRNIDRNISDLEVHHKEKMDSMTDQLDGVTDSLKKLESQYKHTTDSIHGDEVDSVAKQIEKISKLRKELQDMNFFSGTSGEEGSKLLAGFRQGADIGDVTKTEQHGFGWSDDTVKAVNAFMELQKQQGALDQILGTRSDKDSLLSEAGTRNDQTDFEKEFGKLQERAKWEKDQYEESKSQKLEEITRLKEKQELEKTTYQIQRDEMTQTQAALAVWHTDYVSKLNDMANVTKQQVEAMKQNLKDLQNVMNQSQATQKAQAAAPAKRASGGIVSEPYTLVGELGPELVSLPYGSKVHTAEETRTMSGGVTVTIGSVHVHNEADEDRLIQNLVRQIQLQSLSAA